MARPKKDGRRATGIQGKSGFLYIITHKQIIKDGVKKTEKIWIATGLKDNAENIKKASSVRQYPLTDEQLEMFNRLKSKEDTNRNLFGNCYNDNDYIFKHADGSLYYPDLPTKTFARLIKSIPELPQDITFHGLRSSCVSILVHQGSQIQCAALSRLRIIPTVTITIK